MSAPPATAATPGASPPSGSPPSGSWRSLRTPALVAVLVVVAALVSLLASSAPTGRLDPEAAGPDGSRAVARLAERYGAEVRRERTTDAALAALDEAAGPAVLVVVDPGLLQTDALDALASRDPEVPLVLVEPTDDALGALAPGVGVAEPVAPQPLEPACDLPLAERAGVAHAGGLRFEVDDPVASCYPRDGLGSVVRVEPATGGTVTLLGSGEVLTNADLDSEGDAALALGLLEGAEVVVWLLPDPLQELEAGEGSESPTELLPPAVGLVVLQVAVAVVLLALWRARRLGAPVREPLPVVVRAAEVVEGRGRLYRAGRARDVAAEALRDAARARVLPLLGVPAGAGSEQVVDAVAARTGDDPRQVGALLYGAPPSDDAGLGRLATALDTLERRLRSASPAPPRSTEGPRR